LSENFNAENVGNTKEYLSAMFYSGDEPKEKRERREKDSTFLLFLAPDPDVSRLHGHYSR
jgi:hypothetical protein